MRFGDFIFVGDNVGRAIDERWERVLTAPSVACTYRRVVRSM